MQTIPKIMSIMTKYRFCHFFLQVNAYFNLCSFQENVKEMVGKVSGIFRLKITTLRRVARRRYAPFISRPYLCADKNSHSKQQQSGCEERSLPTVQKEDTFIPKGCYVRCLRTHHTHDNDTSLHTR